MYTVTFYSYKGGVGRTLALMNTAFRLSRKGKKVFVLDFDLEAPGVDVFSPAARDAGGLMEFVSEYSRTGRVPPLQDFVSEMQWATEGRVFYMAAGKRDAEYQRMLAQVNWREFYSKERGFLFVENLKGAIARLFTPDYLLVDSRTGMTDISGICTLQLPNLVVLLFGLNEQNLLGTSHIFNSVTRNPLNKEIKTLLVASPVPDVPEYIDVRKQRLERAKELLGTEPDLVLPYNAFVAFKESINPEELGEFLNRQYDTLCQQIINRNRSDVLTMLDEVHTLQQSGDQVATESLYNQILRAHPRSPIAWLEYGSYLRGIGNLEKAIDAYKNSDREGTLPRTLRELAATSLLVGRYDEAHTALRRYLKSTSNLDFTLQVARLFASKDQVSGALEAYNQVLNSSKVSSQLEATALLDVGRIYLCIEEPRRAIEYFQRALIRDPSGLSINYNLAVALHRSGRTEEAAKYFDKSIVMFEQLPELNLLQKDQANLRQAMSQAYAFVGNFEKAISLMREVISLADSISTNLYSSFQYRDVPKLAFIQESEAFLQQLQERSAIPR